MRSGGKPRDGEDRPRLRVADKLHRQPHLFRRRIFIPSSAFCKTPRMFRPGLRSAWDKFARPTTNPTKQWQSFFRPNPRRTLINSSRDNHWPRSPLKEGGKTFNWDAFRWTNYRVASNPPQKKTPPKVKMLTHECLQQ